MYRGKKEFIAILMPDSIGKQLTGYITLWEAGYYGDKGGLIQHKTTQYDMTTLQAVDCSLENSTF